MSDESGNTVEVWKTIAEFPRYSVSNLGRVRNDFPMKRRSAVMFLKPNTDRLGYINYKLCCHGIQKQRNAHRLVALAFLEPDPDPRRNEVNHKNGIKVDNRLSNLEWVTHAENAQHTYSVLGRKGMLGESHPRAKLTNEKVIQIRKLLAQGIVQHAVALYAGVNRCNVSDIALGKAWRHVT